VGVDVDGRDGAWPASDALHPDPRGVLAALRFYVGTLVLRTGMPKILVVEGRPHCPTADLVVRHVGPDLRMAADSLENELCHVGGPELPAVHANVAQRLVP